jgi:hypothetical protein
MVLAGPAGAAPYAAVDLTPTDLPAGTGAQIADVDPSGSQAVGTILPNRVAANTDRAVVWDLATGAHTVLHFGRFTDTTGHGAGDGQQVGLGEDYRFSPTVIHAIGWRGTPQSLIDLHPEGAFFSNAMDTDGVRQVGQAGWGGADNRPILWHGTASSYVDLTPPGRTGGIARGIGGGRQVGYTYSPDLNSRATLWSGAADSAIDLHPAGAFYGASQATDLSPDGAQQVGFAGDPILSRAQHAMLWFGTAESALDLHPPALPPPRRTRPTGASRSAGRASPRPTSAAAAMRSSGAARLTAPWTCTPCCRRRRSSPPSPPGSTRPATCTARRTPPTWCPTRSSGRWCPSRRRWAC